MSVANPDRGPGPPTRTTQPSSGAASVETVDLHTLAPLAAWTRTTQGDSALEAVCTAAGMASAAFSNGGGDVPISQLETWLEALRDRLGGEGRLMAAGLASETTPGGTLPWLRWIGTPALLYRAREGRRWVTAGTGRLTVRHGGIGSATLQYTTTGAPSRVLCLWRQARLSQRTRAWGLAPAVVQETRCLARGDDACEYVVHWQARPRWTGAIAATAATIAGLASLSSMPVLAWTLPAITASLAHAIEVERVRRANRATDAAFGAAFRRATAPTPARSIAPAEETAVADEQTPAIDPETAALRREGDFWRVTFASKTVLIRHSRGMSLLVHLLRNPGEDIHVSALDALSPSDTASPVAASAPVDASIGDLGDAGEVLDAQAKATYRRRITELREELAEAEANNDLGHVEGLRAELEALTDQLRQATGLGGRSRRAASNADRVRVAVTRRIRAAITQIEKHHPLLGAHLSATVHTGYFCSYGPGGVLWTE